MHRVVTFRFPSAPAAVGTGRERLVRGITELAGVELDDGFRDTLRLCASELITNGLEHGGSGQLGNENKTLLIEADLDPARMRLRVTVTDGGLSMPVLAGTSDDVEATGGRGLAIVAACADEIGWQQRIGDNGAVVGFSVWFEVDVVLSDAGRATAHAEVQSAIVAPSGRVGRRQGSRQLRTAASPGKLRSTGMPPGRIPGARAA